jgi:hypothetical protein
MKPVSRAVQAVCLFVLVLCARPAYASNDGTFETHFALGRQGHGSIHDPVRHRMVVMGGYRSGYQNDVWILDPAAPAWSQLVPTGTPPGARAEHSVVYDPVRDRLVLYGGTGDSTYSDVWTLSLAGTANWTRLTPAGTVPVGRYGHTAVYDPVRDRMLVFGGSNGTTDFNQVWALSLAGGTAWSQLTASGTPPATRRDHSMIYDAGSDRLIVFGGYRQIPPSGSQRYQDLWSLSLAGTPTWAELFPSGTAPDARFLHSAMYDPIRRRMLMLGGDHTATPQTLWSLALTGPLAWSQPSPPGPQPAARRNHTTVYDSDGDRMLLFGGNTQENAANTWSLALGPSPSWTRLPVPHVPPLPRDDAGAVFDSVGQRMLLIGGRENVSGQYKSDLWQLSLVSAAPLWDSLAVGDSIPAGREQAAVVIDNANRRVLLFGGSAAANRFNDSWSLSLIGMPTWNRLLPTGTPPTARYGHTGVFDPVRKRLVVFGGYSTAYLNDVAILDVSGGTPAWIPVSPTGTAPSHRRDASAIYDPVRDRMILFGGNGLAGYTNDVWALSLSGTPAWTLLTPSGMPPEGRDHHTAVYDSYRDRMVVVGGRVSSLATKSDVWELLFGSLTWRMLVPSGVSLIGQGHTSVYDRPMDRVVSTKIETQTLTFPLTFRITASAGAGGSIVPSGIVPTVSGSNQTFTFTPAPCYHIGEVLVDGVSVGSPSSYTFTNVQAHHTISVTFALDVETIAATATPQGTIAPSGNVAVNCGSSQTFTITPFAGYSIADVLVDGLSVGEVTSYTFNNVTSTHSIAVSFAPIPIPITPYCATDGSVYAIARAGDRIYIGGAFGRVGPPTGGGGVVDTSSGDAQVPYAFVDGTVSAVTPDGSGGWYVGGLFTSIRGQSRRNLAHVLADGSVAPWDPSPNNQVMAITRSGGVVNVGGRFTSISGEPWHPAFAMLDATTGAIVAPVALGSVGSPPVRALESSSGRVYIGGIFESVGAPTGAWARVSSSSGSPVHPFSGIVNGTVYAAAPDGSGGWFVGGSFTVARGVTRNNVAHFRADGMVSEWNPNVNGTVYALAVSGSSVYVGGAFTTVALQTRNRIAAVNASTGALLTWNPNAGSLVRTIAPSASAIYVGGEFTTIGGVSRAYIAALDPTTGLATSWNPGASSAAHVIVASASAIHVGGTFTTIAGVPRSRVAALDPATGSAQLWNPSANGSVWTLAVTAGAVYAAGEFSSIGGQPRNRIAALNTTNGAALGWNPDANGSVRALAASGSTIYAGGDFTTIGGAPRSYLAALDSAGGLATSWNPTTNGTVHVLQVLGGAVHAGGSFTILNAALRHNLAAVDGVSGAPTAWNPNPNSSGVPYTLLASGGVVYVGGGAITTIGGATRNNLAAVDPLTGAATSWNPNVSSTVRSIAAVGGTVYFGGDFTTVGGQPRTRLAAVDAASGAPTTWAPAAGATVNALLHSNGVVYVGGAFTTIGGQSRNRIAVINAVTGSVLPWNPDASGAVEALSMAGGRLYVGGSFTFLNSVVRSNLASIHVPTGRVTTWNPASNGIVYALQPSGSLLYVGGSFSNVGGASRSNIAAVDSASGLATSWNPFANGSVSALAVSGNVIYAGGNFTSIGSQPRTRLAALGAATGQAIFWNPDPNGASVNALMLVGGGVCVGGDFTSIGGAARNRVAVIDSASGAATAWNPDASGPVYSLARLGNTTFIGGAFAAIGGQSRSNIAAVDGATAATLAWNPGTNGTVSALAATGNTLYLGGAFTTLGSRIRNRIGAVDATSGQVAGWNPNADNSVLALRASSGALDVGGAFTTIGGFANRALAVLQDVTTVDVPTPGVTGIGRIELAQNFPNPFSDRSTIHFALPATGAVTLRLYDIGGRVVATLIDRALMAPGPHNVTVDGRGLRSGVYYYRLGWNGRFATRPLVLLR